MRGRKLSHGLPFSHAREVQRAYRARRVHHLKELEQRIEELEVENIRLCQVLKIQPVARPPLGRGPTGRDVVKGDDKKRIMTRSSLHSENPPNIENIQATTCLTPTTPIQPEVYINHHDPAGSTILGEDVLLHFGPPVAYSQRLKVALSCQPTQHPSCSFPTNDNSPHFEIDPRLSSMQSFNGRALLESMMPLRRT